MGYQALEQVLHGLSGFANDMARRSKNMGDG